MSEDNGKTVLEEQLEAEIEAHNNVHTQITQGEEQLAQLRIERDRRYGRITVLDELVKAEKAENGEVPSVPEAPEAE